MSLPITRTDVKEEYTVLPSRDAEARPVFCVLLKRTYDIRPGRRAERAVRARPLLKVDEYYDGGDAETSTVKYESDLSAYKSATDVVLVGNAYAPRAQPVLGTDVSLGVAGRTKTIRVIGDRRCRYRQGAAPLFTDPEPFTEMEIRYERAYGGEDLLSTPNTPFYYPRNNRGTGAALHNLPRVVDGLRLPNLEDPLDLITPERVIIGSAERWNDQPLPQGLGWFQKTWYPRCSFVGAVPGLMDPDTVLKEETLGLVPKGQLALARQFKLPSFDVRFNSGASLGLALPYLSGDESISLSGLTPDGSLSFSLPGEQPRIGLDLGTGTEDLSVVIHTVCLRMDEMQIDMVWRGARDYPGVDWLPQLKRLAVEVV